MTALFFLVRIPAFLLGFALCLAILPFDYALLFIQRIGGHVLTALLRTVGAPFVIVASALFSRRLWPSYLKKWQRAHREIRADWARPLKRFSELSLWLPGSPRSYRRGSQASRLNPPVRVTRTLWPDVSLGASQTPQTDPAAAGSFNTIDPEPAMTKPRAGVKFRPLVVKKKSAG
jgi:hypothetical protein